MAGGSPAEASEVAPSEAVIPSEVTRWTCVRCTYIHRKKDEMIFLQCGLCGEPRVDNIFKSTVATSLGDSNRGFSAAGKKARVSSTTKTNTPSSSSKIEQIICFL